MTLLHAEFLLSYSLPFRKTTQKRTPSHPSSAKIFSPRNDTLKADKSSMPFTAQITVDDVISYNFPFLHPHITFLYIYIYIKCNVIRIGRHNAISLHFRHLDVLLFRYDGPINDQSNRVEKETGV